MLRLVELALFLAPFAAFAAWRLLAWERGPSRQVVIATACAVVLLLGLLIWFSREEALPPGTVYVPPHVEDGRVIAGHVAPR
jgi:hypothetical protein